MAINIISPEQYQTIPWKNGRGATTQLAISEGDDLTNFEWRLSIATVSENGVFSDFSGYSRYLVLLSGKGIRLEHDNDQVDQVDQLEQSLDMASFDGACKTFGTLTSGPIIDFNIMTKTAVYQAQVKRYIDEQYITLMANAQYFVYGLSQVTKLTCTNENTELPAGYLLAVSKNNKEKVGIKGANLIVIQLVKSTQT